MKRREFIGLLASGVVATTLNVVARGQERMVRIGYLAGVSPDATPDLLGALRAGLRDRGYVEGKNAIIDYRWAADGLDPLAAELAALKVDVIVAWATPAVAAAKRATQNIPIVMVGIADPIGAGFVASLSRPGGNITGTTNLARDLGGKLLEVLLELVPGITPVVVLRNPSNPAANLQLRDIEVAASALKVRLMTIDITNADDIPAVFAGMARDGAKGLIALADPLLISQRARIAELALRTRIPTVFARRENVDAGGLLSYGPSLREQFRDTAHYVDRLLRGADPALLPVEQPRRMELIVNLKTAWALGLTVPLTLLARADEVIE